MGQSACSASGCHWDDDCRPPCQECFQDIDCSDAARPLCFSRTKIGFTENLCLGTCKTMDYHCSGIRKIRNDRALCDPDGCADWVCCSECTSDADCVTSGKPRCRLANCTI